MSSAPAVAAGGTAATPSAAPLPGGTAATPSAAPRPEGTAATPSAAPRPGGTAATPSAALGREGRRPRRPQPSAGRDGGHAVRTRRAQGPRGRGPSPRHTVPSKSPNSWRTGYDGEPAVYPQCARGACTNAHLADRQGNRDRVATRRGTDMSATILRPLIVQRRVAQIRIASAGLNAKAVTIAATIKKNFEGLVV